MGLIEGLGRLLFGEGRNIVRETAEVFMENSEAAAGRETHLRAATLDQYGREFAVPRRGLFDRFMDGLNRVPRPALALGTLGLFVAAMVDPLWFASRMQGIALVPEPLWWLLGAIVSFYFGARYQVKGQEFQQSIAQTMARVPQVMANAAALERLAADRAAAGTARTRGDAALSMHVLAPGRNGALEDWQRSRRAPRPRR